jgi:nuclease A inhibitor-like protein
MNQSIEQALQGASQGLTYQSETDRPFDVFTWSFQSELSAEKVRALGGHPADMNAEETTIGDFFEVPTMDQSWHGPAEKSVVRKFALCET